MDEDMSTKCVISQQQLFKEDGPLCMFSEGKGATTYPLHPCRHLFLLFGHHFSSFLGNFFRKAWSIYDGMSTESNAVQSVICTNVTTYSLYLQQLDFVGPIFSVKYESLMVCLSVQFCCIFRHLKLVIRVKLKVCLLVPVQKVRGHYCEVYGK